MKDIFRKARQNRIFQDVVEQIEGAILDGQVRAGEKLPAERELCEMFQTSRGTLREAFRVLEQKGLIEIKLGVGGGAMVKSANAEPLIENMAMLIRSGKVSLSHLAEFREGVEGLVTGLAARRAGQADVNKLRALLAEAEGHYARGLSGWNDFVQVDEKIHTAISEITGNPLYIFILHTIQDNIQRYYEAHPLKDARILQENYEDLRDIVLAIEKKQVTVVKSLVQSHVRRFNRYMLDDAC